MALDRRSPIPSRIALLMNALFMNINKSSSSDLSRPTPLLAPASPAAPRPSASPANPALSLS